MEEQKPSMGGKYREVLREADRILKLRADPRPWIESNLRIRTKDRHVVPLRFNAVQADYYERRTDRDLILKPRQLGFTTLVSALFFADTVLRPNTVSVMVAHDADSTEKIFGIVRFFWENLPEEQRRRIGKPHSFTRKQFFWPELNSRFYVGTAGSLTFGRGQTINNLHCSEFAFWPRPEEALVALTEAVPREGRIVIESTANGMGNAFHDLWVEAVQGENGYATHFYTWWQDPQYRLAGAALEDLIDEESELMVHHDLDEDQIRWRREKVQSLRDRFLQEYPEDDVTCFLASGGCCFDTRALMLAQQRISTEPKPNNISRLAGRNDETLAVTPARLLVWKDPEPKRDYVIGADVGEGLAHGDPSAACVLDEETGDQVAELHGRVPPDRFARLLDALGRRYNKAYLAVERNNHGHSVLNTLWHTCQYPNLYRHKRYDQLRHHDTVLGWPTDRINKPIMVDDLAEAIVGGYLLIHSSGLVDECFTFILTDSGAQEAQSGKHDDRVIAAAIAWQMKKRPRPRFLIARASYQSGPARSLRLP